MQARPIALGETIMPFMKRFAAESPARGRGKRAFTLIYGDATGLYDAALKACPELVMAYLGKAWPLVLANDPVMAVSARALLNAACKSRMNDRERAYGDPNNSKKGCGLQTFNGDYTVEQFQICEDDGGDDTCSKWQDVD